MITSSNARGPKFVEYFQPVLDGLKELGSSAKPREVYSWIAEHQNVSKSEIGQVNKGGQSRFENKVEWARFYLAKAGLIETERRGIWILTAKGRVTSLSHEEALELFRTVQVGFQRGGDEDIGGREILIDQADISAPDDKSYIIRIRFRWNWSICSERFPITVLKNYAQGCSGTSGLKT